MVRSAEHAMFVVPYSVYTYRHYPKNVGNWSVSVFLCMCVCIRQYIYVSIQVSPGPGPGPGDSAVCGVGLGHLVIVIVGSSTLNSGIACQLSVYDRFYFSVCMKPEDVKDTKYKPNFVLYGCKT